MSIQTLCYLTFNTIEGTTTDEQDVTGVNGNILLIRMLTATLGRNIYVRTLQQLQQALLHTFSTDITRNGRIICLTCYLIDLINKHNTTLCGFHIIISHLQQTSQNTLDIFAHITCLCKHRCINNSKRNIQQFGYRTCQQGLTRTC